MAWASFPYFDDAYWHTPASLQAAWARLHAGDAEPFPTYPRLVEAWIAFHAGEFERACRIGLDVGVDGYSVAHKATCIYATYLEKSEKKKIATFEEVAERWKVSERTVMRLADSGELPCVRIGSRRRFRPCDVQDYINRQSNTTAPEVAA